ncbi:MAG: hypothetical protein COU82_00610 [Candidatus Portnoybacteria bacterium CG10_big_fil_rev_8_21_14_0_10_38_18]|uniref:PsbP C-terminal domain-containing protein n=1 Tax=Candidatus Portnoybacteria bacterium CG10_big_fil_rev_8_21_14_0_10_38_18 TaxID=1974813 RepID=A0A2M8KCP4_9BACT|nr:MAG: hypothetical protein COU82_00610 [Candidatus Portnoybacteria bacterium CG10_big_fil_rev_8_21_14_0_10_38_18]
MKKHAILVIVLIILIAGAIGFYLYKNGKLIGPKPEEETPQTEQDIVTKDGFSLKIPDGWAEVANPQGALMTAVDTNEVITDVNAQQLNFRSYFSVIPDNLGDKTKEQYYQEIKDSLKQVFPDILFSREDTGLVDNKDTYFLEAEFNQEGVDFRVLLAINMGESDVWIISFNTLKSSWDNYKDIFYNTAESLKLNQT